ncbi:MAG TPA: DUF6159 family protein [Methanoregulaceae archaeon]|nr:DUF6159 family protein [Methanoregulaceae archaeon]
MFESFSRSFTLIRESWKVLSLDKEILLFPVLSGIALLVVLISFVIPLFFSGLITDAGPVALGAWYIPILFLFYLFCYFIIIFFNAALIACARIRLTGGDPVFMDGIRSSLAHIVPIFLWALVAATVGLVLRLLEDRFNNLIGQIVLSLIGAAWSLITYFVIPVMIFEEKGTFTAMKESIGLFRKTWGESIIGQASIGIVFVILALVGIIPVGIALLAGSSTVFVVLAAIYVLYLALIMVVGSALQGIYNTALYLYAKTGTVPEAFTREIVETAFVPKPAGVMRGNI